MHSDLVSLFVNAVKVEAQSLRERPMAEFVRAYLDGLSVKVVEDNTAPHFQGECGNLICIPAGFDPALPAVALLAHMDTPRPTLHVNPVVTDTRISSDGTTALGVDNRAGTAVLMHALRQHALSGAKANFIVVFSVGEELGLYGSKYVDLAPYNVKQCFVFDCSKRPGTYIQSCVGCSLYTATFIGKPSHAAVAPEKGVSAITMAAEAIRRIPQGRLSPTMTTNIGMIHGGTATNVVPAQCKLEGEVREYDKRVIEEHLAFLRETFQSVASEFGGAVEFQAQEDFAPFRLATDSDLIRMTDEILLSVGLKPNPIEYLGGSDANMLNGKGVPAVNLGIGAQNPHGDDEFILIEDLVKTEEIAFEIIKRVSGRT
ncbi:MAG: M20/M25/M40 family metallo-hydrolase [Ignavibacteriae bacterium]|nr:M20/M25/M40 family metallo-hydrolase [Ignavibacteriota bacterium]